MHPVYEKLMNCYEQVRAKTDFVPKVALVLGSGLGDYADDIRIETTVDYGEIEGFPQKVFYILSCFRHEKPQAGRLREFHQFGCEMIGAQNARADADVIALAKSVIDRMGLQGIKLNINSIGCKKCRADYHKALVDYFTPHKAELCETCQERLTKNPMRIIDCKSPICSKIAEGAPVILDFLCEECDTHFKELQENLKAMKIDYSINPKIVRGLDYYTKTVFEFITTDIGAQGTVCGGGRYDGLIETLGGAPTPALGFGMGLERLILTMESQGVEFEEPAGCELYIAPMGDNAARYATGMIAKLRDLGIFAEYDLIGRSLKAQMKYADKIGAKFVMVLGDNEIEQGQVNIKNMETGEQTAFTVDDTFAERLCDFLMASIIEGIDTEGLI